MNRALQVLFLLVVIGAGGAASYHASRLALEPRSPDPVPTPTSIAGTEASTPDATDSRPDDGPATSGETPPTGTSTGTETLDPDLRLALRTGGETWNFAEPADSDRLLELIRREQLSAPADRTLASRWLVQRELRSRLEPQLESIPETVETLELDNGRRLYAREVRRQGETIHVVTLTGIEAGFPASSVRKQERIERETYLRRTHSQYEAEIESVDRAVRVDLERGIRRAIERGDTKQANRLFDAWIQAGGPVQLAQASQGPVAKALRVASAALCPDTPSVPSAIASTIPRPTTAEGGASVRPEETEVVELPISLADLQKRLADTRARLKRKVDPKLRQTLFDRLTRWEEWLDRQPRTSDVATLAEIQQELQFLRLDLLKSGGF